MTAAERPDAGEGLDKACINQQAHRPHQWAGFPPDVWRCPGRSTLTADELTLLGQAFGGSTPSALLTTRVERIIAARETAAAAAVVGRVEALAENYQVRADHWPEPRAQWADVARDLRAALRAGEAGDE